MAAQIAAEGGDTVQPGLYRRAEWRLCGSAAKLAETSSTRDFCWQQAPEARTLPAP
jgi:hypothetical protein